MLRHLRDSTGGPALRVRVVALLVLACMLAVAAPAIVGVVSWLLNALV